MIIYEDIVSGAGATQTENGWELRRKAIVSGIPSGVVGYNRVLYAGQLLNANGSFIGAQHPALPTAYLKQIDLNAVSPDMVEFSLTYRERTKARVVFNSGLSSEPTNVDKDGNAITLSYKYPSDYVDPVTGETSALAGQTVTQGGYVNKYIPDISFTYTREETLTPSQIIALKITYVGAVNTNGWNLFGTPQPPRAWLCTSITGDSDDGVNYNVSYSFSFRRNVTINNFNLTVTNWQPWAVFVRDDGKPAPDAAESETNNALKEIPVYEEIDFGPLNLTL